MSSTTTSKLVGPFTEENIDDIAHYYMLIYGQPGALETAANLWCQKYGANRHGQIDPIQFLLALTNIETRYRELQQEQINNTHT